MCESAHALPLWLDIVLRTILVLPFLLFYWLLFLFSTESYRVKHGVSVWALFFCLHRRQTFCRNIYGDEINLAGGNRSIWRCERCKHYRYHKELHEEIEHW